MFKKLLNLIFASCIFANALTMENPFTELRDIVNQKLFEAVSEGSLADVESAVNRMGIDVNVKLPNGFTPLILASARQILQGPNLDARLNNKYHIIEFLVTHGANVKDASNSGYTALMGAADSNDPKLVEYLIKLGADVNAYTVLRDADTGEIFKKQSVLSRARTPEIRKLLIDAGAK